MRKILLVDDDDTLRQTMHVALGLHGYEVSGIGDAEQALEQFPIVLPDLVILDWHLPGMSGGEVCRALKTRSSVPVILISAHLPHAHREAATAGAELFLAKPFSFDELLMAVKTVLPDSPPDD